MLGKKIERRKVKDFDYNATGQEKLEIPLAERIAAIRERKRGERARSAERAANPTAPKRGQPHRRRRGNRSGASSRRTA